MELAGTMPEFRQIAPARGSQLPKHEISSQNWKRALSTATSVAAVVCALKGSVGVVAIDG